MWERERGRGTTGIMAWMWRNVCVCVCCKGSGMWIEVIGRNVVGIPCGVSLAECAAMGGFLLAGHQSALLKASWF